MDEQPIVTIVTPSFNTVQYLERTIQSVLEQDYPHIEYIVMDAGSTDGTLDVIRKYENRIAQWVSEPDRGQSHAINKGWACGHGSILAWLNADDRYASPTTVREAVEYLQAHPEVMMVHGQAKLEDTSGNLIGVKGVAFNMLSMLCSSSSGIIQPSVFVRRAALDKVGNVDEDLHYKMDGDLWLRIALHFPVGFVPHVWARIIVHPTMKSNAPQAHLEVLKVTRKFYDLVGLPPEVHKVRRQAFALAYIRHARGNMMLGRHLDARLDLFQAIRLYPGVLRLHRSLVIQGLLGERVNTALRFFKSRYRAFLINFAEAN
ncbi:MAG: glycosyltransferase [Nitrospirae bacterium]|nr:glycosyltransferase [Nitrospirota bacterium]